MPGIGPRSATRIAYYLLDRKRNEAIDLAAILDSAMKHIVLCSHCRNYSDDDCCDICKNVKRQNSGLLCVVETPSDMQAIEQGGSYQGLYYILHGHISPIDGIGPDELGFDGLIEILKSGKIKELILATNATVEGDATAQYLAALAKKYGVLATQLASGIPQGGELDNIDEHTIATSLMYRRRV